MVKGITDYGKAIRMRLVELNQTQEWLIESVRERTGLYFDSSYLYKILTGRLSTPKVVEAINEILGVTM
jgi:hypothetical protein